MSKFILALLCVLLAAPALAQNGGSAANQTPADEAPADVDMANVRAAGQPASAPSAAAPAPSPVAQPAAAQPAPAPGGAGQGAVEEPKSAIPLDKRQGPDITKCLEAGDKSDKAINACADKYRPRGQHH